MARAAATGPRLPDGGFGPPAIRRRARIVLASGLLHRALTRPSARCRLFSRCIPPCFRGATGGRRPRCAGDRPLGADGPAPPSPDRIPALDDVVAAGIFVGANLAVCALAERLRRDQGASARRGAAPGPPRDGPGPEGVVLPRPQQHERRSLLHRPRTAPHVRQPRRPSRVRLDAEESSSRRSSRAWRCCVQQAAPRPIEQAPPCGLSLKGCVHDGSGSYVAADCGIGWWLGAGPRRGGIVGAVSVVRDITEQRRIEGPAQGRIARPQHLPGRPVARAANRSHRSAPRRQILRRRTRPGRREARRGDHLAAGRAHRCTTSTTCSTSRASRTPRPGATARPRLAELLAAASRSRRRWSRPSPPPAPSASRSGRPVSTSTPSACTGGRRPAGPTPQSTRPGELEPHSAHR